MQKICQTHENRISLVCFHQGCNQPLLCRSCFKGHPDSHESAVKDLIDLTESNKWLDDKEAQKHLEVKKIEKAFQEKDELGAVNESSLKEIISFTRELITQIEQRWTRELDTYIASSRLKQELNELFYELKKEMGLLGLYELRSDDVYESIQRVKKFNDDVVPRVQKLCDQAEDALNKMKISQDKVKIYKDELSKILNGVHVEDLFASRPFGKMERPEKEKTGELKDLTEENLQLKMKIEELRKIRERSEITQRDMTMENDYLKKMNEELKKDIQNLEMNIQKSAYNYEKESHKNLDLKEKIEQLQRKIESLESQEGSSNQDCVEKIEFQSNKNDQLSREIKNLMRENAMLKDKVVEMSAKLQEASVTCEQNKDDKSEEKFEREIKFLREDKNKLEKEIQVLSLKYQQDKERSLELEEMTIKMKQKLCELEKDGDNLRKNYFECQTKIRILVEENERLSQLVLRK